MGITKLGENQELTRHARWVTVLGTIHLASAGELSNTVSQAPLVTGQQRPSGQIQAMDVTMTIPLENREDVAKVEQMKSLADAGAPGYLLKGSSVQYEKVNGQPGAAWYLPEAWVHTTTSPSTDANAAGDGAMYTFVVTVWGARYTPGS